jgi:hypothetical protein
MDSLFSTVESLFTMVDNYVTSSEAAPTEQLDLPVEFESGKGTPGCIVA